jgi:uncharacterized protein
MTPQSLELPMTQITDFCYRYAIRRIAVLDSVLRDTAKREHDIDVLIEFEPGYVPGLALVRMQKELSALLGNCPVTMVQAGFPNRRVRERRLTHAEDIYLGGTVVRTHLPHAPRSVNMVVMSGEQEQARAE